MGVRDYAPEAFTFPETLDDVIAAVNAARPNGKLRVRGSEHSEKDAVYTDPDFDPMATRPSPRRNNLILDKLRGITLEDGIVRVGAGCHIGADPFSLGPARDFDNSLVAFLHRNGRALPALGGISHQSVGGFLATGSAGGSLRHDITDALAYIHLVDGTGTQRRIARGDPAFDAAVVHLGLLGVVVEVGFALDELPEAFDVQMMSDSLRIDDWTEGRPFEEGGLEAFFRANEYARCLWWPQPLVDRVQVWTGRRVRLGPPEDRKPYVSIAPPAQHLASWLYRKVLPKLTAGGHLLDAEAGGAALTPMTSTLRAVLHELATSNERPGGLHSRQEGLTTAVDAILAQLEELASDSAQAARRPTWREALIASIIRVFIAGARHDDLRDVWYDALPHDNQVNDDVVPVLFTEMWVPFAKAHQAMLALRDLFNRERLAATGTMCFELYPAKARSHWLSPAYEADVLRVDPFVFRVDADTHAEAIRDFFPRHWETLKSLGFRFHWAKALSEPGSSTGVAYRRSGLPRFQDFLDLRSGFDPDGVFLNQYWARHLGIPPPGH